MREYLLVLFVAMATTFLLTRFLAGRRMYGSAGRSASTALAAVRSA